MKKKWRFTIIEFMIVLSVLMILFSLLQPSLKSAYHAALITLCQSQFKNSSSTAIIISEDRDLYLPEGGAVGSRTFWLSRSSVLLFEEYGLLHQQLTCPSINQGDMNVEKYSNIKELDYLIHNQYLGNNAGLMSRANAKVAIRSYRLAKKSSQNGDLPLFADGNSSSPFLGGWTMAPHTDFMGRQYIGQVDFTVLGSEGANVAYLDGSVHWKEYDELTLYANSRYGLSLGLW